MTDDLTVTASHLASLRALCFIAQSWRLLDADEVILRSPTYPDVLGTRTRLREAYVFQSPLPDFVGLYLPRFISMWPRCVAFTRLCCPVVLLLAKLLLVLTLSWRLQHPWIEVLDPLVALPSGCNFIV